MENKSLNIIIVEKNASLKMLGVKDFKEEELYKKCGFKKPDGFCEQTKWSIKLNGEKYNVRVYAKTDGRANSENKYDFPPPIDTKLFFGNCAIIAEKQDLATSHDNIGGSKYKFTNLSLELWEKMYEKLFGGFEDLTMTAIEDENEIDELENIPKEKKTKDGYLKDGFVVDSSDTDEDGDGSNSGDDDDDADNGEDTTELDGEEDLDLEMIGSELSEDDYDYETCSSADESENDQA